MVAKQLPGGWVVDPEPRRTRSINYLFDLYYAYFHDSHPWLPPKQIMFRLVEGRPDDFDFMMAMILYIGSIYSINIGSAELRQRAYDMASGPLPQSVWSVQALLCLSIATYGEGYANLPGDFFQRALEMALDLGLHNKSFADSEANPILAESYRRTYWALYLHGSLRTVRDHLGHFQLYYTPTTTDLPCEEWEYQAGCIPTPESVEEFYQITSARNHSSWAFLVDLVRISGEYVLPLLNAGSQAEAEAVDSADYRIVSWLLKLPQWKKELVDPDGVVDLILYHAIGIAHGLRIRIQLQLHGAGVQFRVPSLVRDGPIFRPSSLLPSNVTTISHAWLYGPTALQGSLALVGLFKSHLPPEKFSPSCTLGLERAVMPLLDTYLFGETRTPFLKDRIMLLADVLGKAGEFWPIAKSASEDIIGAVEGADERVDDYGKPGGLEMAGLGQAINDIVSSPAAEEVFYADPLNSTGETNAWASNVLGTDENTTQWDFLHMDVASGTMGIIHKGDGPERWAKGPSQSA
ncbi:hypothetical protein QQX98_011446 [Neonectria punicea]|uniref:Xylanolytic transcriptional activator regulatory domain-containing protein n=1 Tax=Neonectria punicea TaxID=979145 RepID=A0ABR1GLM1_9HYPO